MAASAGSGSARGRDPLARSLLSLPALVYLLVGVCVPLGVLFAYSLWPSVNGDVHTGDWSLVNYERFFTDSIYWRTLIQSFVFTGIAALCTTAAAFPFAYFIAFRVPPCRRALWLVATLLPFSASYLIRVFAWLNLLGDQGILNAAVMRLHLASHPLAIFGYDRTAIVITFMYLFFPLAFVMTYVAIERLDPSLLDSSADLGARPVFTLARVVIPLARTGLLAAFALCVVSMIGDYFTPTLVGGTNGTLFSTFVQSKFDLGLEWGFGSALAFILFASTVLLIVIARRGTGSIHSIGTFGRSYVHRRALLLRTYALLCLIVIYTPIVLVVLLAFNRSEITGLPIEGLTLSWFGEAIHDPILIGALHTSLDVAAWALVISLCLGTPAAVQLARSRGRLKSLTLGVCALPIILPPIMVGVGIVITLHALGAQRGFWTIVVAHSLFITPVVVFIILVRLEGIDPDLELAAMDLGARPWRAFLWVTVPEALPAILAAALIGLAMSMDEFIVTYLVTGTQVTLPLFIYSSIQYQITPELNALSAMMVASSFLLTLVALGVLKGSRALLAWRSSARWKRPAVLPVQ
jgi:spermidine/putrescine transport system permease protein